MTFLLGIFSVLMITFLPGALLLKAFHFNRPLSLIFKLSAIFALSLVINYLMVFFLVLTHSYFSALVRMVGALELLGFVWVYRRAFLKNMNIGSALEQHLLFYTQDTDFLPYRKALFYFSLLVLAGIFYNWVHSFGDVFGPWDPTVSYGRWATDFAGNHLPVLTWHYPQLLPTNWSLSYVCIGPLPRGIELEAFPAAIQGLFFIAIPFLMYALYEEKKQIHFLLALLLFSYFSFADYSVYLNAGYADYAVAFFNFLALVFTLTGVEHQEKSLGWLALIFAFGAAATKPSGIYTAMVIPLLQFLLRAPAPPFAKGVREIFLKWLGLGLVIAPWYLYASLHETQHHEAFGDIHFLLLGTLHLDGFKLSLFLMLALGLTAFVFLFSAFLFRFVLSRSLQYILYCYGPYYFIWLLGFEYDDRNLVFIWPILCLLFSAVLMHQSMLFKAGAYVRTYLYKIPRLFIMGLLLFAMLVLGIQQSLSEPALLHHQIAKKNLKFDTDVLVHLYAYLLSPGVQGKIVTDYSYFNYLPFLQPHMAVIPLTDYGNNMSPTLFKDLPALGKFMVDNDVHYLLLDQHYITLFESKDFQNALAEWLKSKKVSREFTVNQVSLYKVNVPVKMLFCSPETCGKNI